MFYEINTGGRWIAAQIEYNAVAWTSFDAIVDAFNSRVQDWYIKPADILEAHEDSGHLAFPVMALNCILLDTLSQFHRGSGAENFKEFTKAAIPEMAAALPTNIWHVDESTLKKKDPKKRKIELKTYADVLYHAFRCGILHEAHVAAYGMVRGGNLVEFFPNGFTWYKGANNNNTDCPTVNIDPWKLLKKVKDVLAGYIAKLKDKAAANDDLRAKFKKKFTESFGVDITNAQ